MSKNNIYHDSDFLPCLSEEEQETLAGGQSMNVLGSADFFLQKTDIQTEAENNVNLAGGESGSQTTRYNLSQVTMASSITFGIPNFSDTSNRVNNFVTNVLRGLFSQNINS
ncbi:MULTISPECIES: hypothetical protein [unclassified Anabaena]|uniref:hypothetical protein n=1 Tax=unclassified Anabaena TaxID=2619674 RepID=UPI0039C5D2AF